MSLLGADDLPASGFFASTLVRSAEPSANTSSEGVPSPFPLVRTISTLRSGSSTSLGWASGAATPRAPSASITGGLPVYDGGVTQASRRASARAIAELKRKAERKRSD